MKVDKTPPSSPITASEKPFSNRQQKQQPPPKAAQQPSPKPQTLPSQKTTKKKNAKEESSMKSLFEDTTGASESTAHGPSATTPNQQHQQQLPESASTASAPPARTAFPANAGPIMGRPIHTPAPDYSGISPTPVPEELNFSPFGKKAAVNQEFMKMVDGNINKIQKDQSKEFSWIRRLSNQKWFPFLDIFMTGFTLLFFTIGIYVVCYINPSLEMKLTPEFISKIRTLENTKAFDKCTHVSWIQNENSDDSSFIDDHWCFGKHKYGRIIFEKFRTTSPNSSDECSVDRVEVHQCYSKNETADPMNIFWGFNNTKEIEKLNFYCNGNFLATQSGLNPNSWAFYPVVLRHSLINFYPNLTNRIVSSTAFFFQCPKCVLGNRYERAEKTPGFLWYEEFEEAPSIPNRVQRCSEFWPMSCDFDSNAFIADTIKLSYHNIVPFAIVEDSEFCR